MKQVRQGNFSKKNGNYQKQSCTRTTSIENVTNRKRGVSETLPVNQIQISLNYDGELKKREKQSQRLSRSKEKDRRKEIGLDFLNKIPKKRIEQLVQRQRTHKYEFQHIHSKLSHSQQKQIQQYQKKKSISHQKKKSIEQQKDIAQHQKIQQNLNKLVAYIKQSTQFPKKRSLTKQHIAKKNSTSKTRNQTLLTIQEGELIEKYKQLQERYSKLFHSATEYDESCCVQYITDTEILPSQNTSQKQTQAAQDVSLNNEERFYLKEFGRVEKELITKHQAAIYIQKVWRGFITRKKFIYQLFDYPKRSQEIVNQETFRSSIRLDRYSQSIQQGKEDTLQQLTHQTDIQMLLDLESEQKEIKQKPYKMYDKFVRFQKMKWQEMLSYISNLQKEDSKRDLKDVLQDLKQFTYKCSQDCSLTKLTTKPLEIKVPQFSQESIVMSEIRQAMCSEKMIRKTLQSSEKYENEVSIFDQNPFQEFAYKKINELINMEKMNELLKIREQVINERKRSEQEVLISQFNDQLISPQTFQHQNIKIEKWVSKQQKELSDHKKRFENGWKGLYDTFINTQKDIKFLSQQKSLSNSICSQYQSITYPSITEQNIFQGVSQHQDTFLISQSNDCGRMKTMTSKSPSPNEKQPINILDQKDETIEWDDEYLLESEQIVDNKNGLISIEQLMQGADQEISQQAQSAFLSQLLVSQEIDLLFYELLKHNIDISKQSLERRVQIQEPNARRQLEAKLNIILHKKQQNKQEFHLKQMTKILKFTKEEQQILNQFHQELLEILNQKWLSYDTERFDIILDLDQLVFDFLIEEIVSDLQNKF